MSPASGFTDRRLISLATAPDVLSAGVIENARRRQRRRRLVSIAALTMIAAVIAGYILHVGGPTERLLPPRASSGPPGSTADVLGGAPLQVTGGQGSVWVLTCQRNCSGRAFHSTGQLLRVNRRSGRILQRFDVADPTAFAIGNTAIWLTHFNPGTVTRIDPRTGQTTQTLSLRLPTPIVSGDRQFAPVNISAGRDSVWVTTARGWAARINARSGRLTAMVTAPFDVTGKIVVGPHATWIAESTLGMGVLKTGSHRIHVRAIPSSRDGRISVDELAVGDGIVWTYGETAPGYEATITTTDAYITALNERTGRIIRQLRFPAGAYGIVIYPGGGLIAANYQTGLLYRIDPHYAIHRLHSPPAAGTLVTATHGAIWATTKSGALRRYGVPNG